jgi:hypothetical protein
MRTIMIKFQITFLLFIIFLCTENAQAIEIRIFDAKLNLPENCYYTVNNKTFFCEDTNGFVSAVEFSKPEEHLESIVKTKHFSNTQKDRPPLEVITNEVSGKMHSLVLLKEQNELPFYVYSICGEKHCISIFTSEMALVYSIFGPVTDDFIFWNAVDTDS